MIPGVVASQLLFSGSENGGSDTKFIAVGSDDTQNAAIVITSPEGAVWTSQVIFASGPLMGIATNGTRWVAVGTENDFATPMVFTSDNGGASWTTRTADPSSDAIFYSVAWTGAAFIAVGNNAADSNPRIMTSPDGATWTARTADPTTNTKLRSVSAISGLAIACGWNSTNVPKIMSSTNDGASWTARTASPTTQRQLNGVVCQSSRSVIVGVPTSGTTTPVQSSSDGTTWATETGAPSTGVDLYAVTHNGTLFVAVGTDHALQIDPKIMTSLDGDTWTARTPDPSSGGGGGINLVGVGSSSTGAVIAVGRDQGFNSPYIMSSSDGMTWTARTPSPSSSVLLFAVAGI